MKHQTLSSQKRIFWIDWAKAIGISLVVWGHFSPIARHEIFLFHMPFFFMLSGYLAWRVKRFDVSFFNKKARTLLLPCFMVGLMFTLINREYDAFIFSEFHDGYWFLWSLFCIWCLFALVKWFISLCRIKNVLIEIGILLLPFFMIKLGGNIYCLIISIAVSQLVLLVPSIVFLLWDIL